MLTYEARDVGAAVSLVTSCVVDPEDAPSGVLVVEFEASRLPNVVAALSLLTAEVLRHFSTLVERPYEELLQVYALRSTRVEGEVHPEVLRSLQESSMLLTASSEPELLGSLVGSVSPMTVPALAEIAAKLLSEIQEVDFSAPLVVLDRCSAAVQP